MYETIGAMTAVASCITSDVRALRARGYALLDELVRAHPLDVLVSRVLGSFAPGSDGRDVALRIEREWSRLIDGASFTLDGSRAKVRVLAGRAWIDFSITHQGIIYPVNFKAGRGRSADNVGGMKVWRYLLGETIDPHTHDLATARITEVDLAVRAAQASRTRTPIDPDRAREYFCLHYNTATGHTHRFGVSDLSEGALRVNPKNGLQVRMDRASGCGRDTISSQLFIIDRYRDYLRSAAAPYLAFQEIAVPAA